MSIQRLTISLPEYLHQKLLTDIPSGKISKFIASVLEEKLLSLSAKSEDPVKDFMDLRSQLPKTNRKKIFEAINKGKQ